MERRERDWAEGEEEESESEPESESGEERRELSRRSGGGDTSDDAPTKRRSRRTSVGEEGKCDIVGKGKRNSQRKGDRE